MSNSSATITTTNAVGNVDSLSYHTLQKECSKAGLGAKGPCEVLRKRLCDHLNSMPSPKDNGALPAATGASEVCYGRTAAEVATSPAAAQAATGGSDDTTVAAGVAATNPTSNTTKPPPPKRHKGDNNHFQDLICPIGHELPISPVVAQDGRIYERSQIDQYFDSKPGTGKVPSPLTQKPMGRKYVSAPNIKNHIESMVMNGYIDGYLAEKWKEKFALKKRLGELMEKAEKKRPLSNVDMKSLGEWCLVGNSEVGFQKNFKMALQMFETLHLGGDPEGTAQLGRMFYNGQGCTPNPQKGLAYLGMARAKRSSLGTYYLAECFAYPKFGFPVDVAEACTCYKLSLRMKHREDGENKNCRGLTADDVLNARKHIADLMKEIPAVAAATLEPLLE